MLQHAPYIVITISYCGEGATPVYRIQENPFYSIRKALGFIQEEGENLAETVNTEDYHWEEPHIFAFILQENVFETFNESKVINRLLFNGYGTLIDGDISFHKQYAHNLPFEERELFQPGASVLVYNPTDKTLEEGVVIENPSKIDEQAHNSDEPNNSDNSKYYIATGINKANYYLPTTVLSPYSNKTLSPELFGIYKSFCK